jgi:hypothetical protein
MLKSLLPDTSISSNAIIPSDSVPIEEEDRLQYYEYDVSFISSS